VHVVEEPQEEFLGVMLQGTLVLRRMASNDVLEPCSDPGVILSTPQALQEKSEVLCDITRGTKLLGIVFVFVDVVLY